MKLIMVFASCAIAIIYLGVVFGIIMMCESMPELHRVKKYAWILPQLEIRFIFHVLCDHTIKEKSRFLISFLFYDEKNMLFAFCIAKALDELTVKSTSRTTPKVRHARKRQLFSNVIEQASNDFDKLCIS